MKKSIAIYAVVVCMIIMTACSRNNNSQNTIEAPANVKASFERMYPEVKDAKWEKEGGNYEANFKTEGKDVSVVFDQNGDYFEMEEDIVVSNLPNSISAYVSNHYGGAPIEEAEKITDKTNTITYETKVKGKELYFNSNGKFIKEETSEKSDKLNKDDKD